MGVNLENIEPRQDTKSPKPRHRVTQLNLYLRQAEDESPPSDLRGVTKYINVEEFSVIGGVLSFWHTSPGNQRREFIVTNLPFKVICEES